MRVPISGAGWHICEGLRLGTERSQAASSLDGQKLLVRMGANFEIRLPVWTRQGTSWHCCFTWVSAVA